MAYAFSTCFSNRGNYGSARSVAGIKYIVIHYTANRTDTAANNARYSHNNLIGVSAHYYVDDNTVVQSVLDVYTAWAVGGKKLSNQGGAKMNGVVTNANSISIEMCSKGSVITEATQENAIALIKQLMAKYDIPACNVYRHFDVTGKCCPSTEYTGIWVSTDKWVGTNPVYWNAFLAKLNGTTGTTTPSEGTNDDSTTYSHVQFIKDVQSAIGTTVDGIAGPKTLAATVTVSASKNYRHAVVKPLQKRLNALGYNCGTVDGIAGKKFTIAVKNYQSAVVGQKNPDGEITAKKATWKKLLGIS